MGVYRDLKDALEQELSRLARLPEVKGPQVARLLDKLKENRFNLVILGAFKRGKSTLINALLGRSWHCRLALKHLCREEKINKEYIEGYPPLKLKEGNLNF